MSFIINGLDKIKRGYQKHNCRARLRQLENDKGNYLLGIREAKAKPVAQMRMGITT
jgi:hypothetical protein